MPRPRHSFVVASHGRSPYLERCLESLHQQTRPSPITISTSRPFDGLQEIAQRYGAALRTHAGGSGIGADWNLALRSVDSELVTIAHQDDTYAAAFATEVVEAHDKHPAASLSFCNSDEIGDRSTTVSTLNHRVKQVIVSTAFIASGHAMTSWRKRLLLGFGNPIICASVTLNRTVAPTFSFREDMRTNMDWLAWIELAGRGGLLHIPKTLVHRRVHEESETARCIADGSRQREDRQVFNALWPRPIAAALASAYRLSYSGYFK